MSGNHPVQRDIPWSHPRVDRILFWWVVVVVVVYVPCHHLTMENLSITLLRRVMFPIHTCLLLLRRIMHGELLHRFNSQVHLSVVVLVLVLLLLRVVELGCIRQYHHRLTPLLDEVVEVEEERVKCRRHRRRRRHRHWPIICHIRQEEEEEE